MSLVPYTSVTGFAFKNTPNSAFTSNFIAAGVNSVITFSDFATNTLASVNNAQSFSGLQSFAAGISLGTAGTPSGYTPSALSHYEEGTFNATFDSGMYTTGSVIAVTFRRIGKVVTLTFPQTRVTANATSAVWFTSGANVPAYLRPAGDQALSVRVSPDGGGTFASGYLRVLNEGTMALGNDVTWTSGQANCGFWATSVTYCIA